MLVKDWEITSADGAKRRCTMQNIIEHDGKNYVLMTIENDESQYFIMEYIESGGKCAITEIDELDVPDCVREAFEKFMVENFPEAVLYKTLRDDKYKKVPYYYKDLDEGMAVVEKSMLGRYKPYYLINHNTKRAYQFIDDDFNLLTITKDDIDWESLKGLPENAISCAEGLSFLYPSFIHHYEKGVAQVSWQLVPDGRFYMDDDGYGREDCDEIEIYGFIDQCGRAAGKFRYQKNGWGATMKREAQTIVKERNSTPK